MRVLELLRQGEDLYSLSLDASGHIIFTLLPYSLAEHIQRLIAEHPQAAILCEEYIWQACVVEHPYEDLDQTLAGTIATVAALILHLSALPALEDKKLAQQECRQRVQNDFMQQAQIVICRAFPAYRPEDLYQMTLLQLLRRLAQAEIILDEKLELKPHDPKRDKKPTFDPEALNRRLWEYENSPP